MTRESEIVELLKKREALLHGHFGLSSGKHSNVYVQCALATEYAEDAEKIARAIKEKLEENNIHPDVVVGPAIFNIIIFLIDGTFVSFKSFNCLLIKISAS